MAINYDALPSSKPQSVLPAGYYMATIVKAEMKRSNNTGSEYLSLQYDLNNGAGVTGASASDGAGTSLSSIASNGSMGAAFNDAHSLIL